MQVQRPMTAREDGLVPWQQPMAAWGGDRRRLRGVGPPRRFRFCVCWGEEGWGLVVVVKPSGEGGALRTRTPCPLPHFWVKCLLEPPAAGSADFESKTSSLGCYIRILEVCGEQASVPGARAGSAPSHWVGPSLVWMGQGGTQCGIQAGRFLLQGPGLRGGSMGDGQIPGELLRPYISPHFSCLPGRGQFLHGHLLNFCVFSHIPGFSISVSLCLCPLSYP